MKQIFDLFTRAEIEIIVNTGRLSEEQKALFKRAGIAQKEAINYAKEVLKYLPSDEAEEFEEEEIEETMWFDCLTANTKIAQYLKKGKKVYIEGNPKINKYHSEKTGEFEAKITINTTIIRLLSLNDQPKSQSQTPPQKQAQPKEQTEQAQATADEDLPF